jgi:hypothetical protein
VTTADTTPEAAIKELAVLVREQVGDLERRHYMINLLAGVSAHLFILREDLQEARDLLAELAENAAK